MTWPKSDMPSRTEPAPRRAMRVTADGSAGTPSRDSTPDRWRTSSAWGRRLNTKCWQRLTMVWGNFSGSVVAMMKVTCPGGSSRVFRSALKACLESMCASSMMMTL